MSLCARALFVPCVISARTPAECVQMNLLLTDHRFVSVIDLNTNSQWVKACLCTCVPPAPSPPRPPSPSLTLSLSLSLVISSSQEKEEMASSAGGRITASTGANLLGQNAQERNQEATCFVGNLEPECTEEIIWELFVQTGRVGALVYTERARAR